MASTIITKRPYKVRANPKQTIGQRIKWLRARMKPYMTQQQLADRSKVGVLTIWRLEKDYPLVHHTRLDTLHKVAVGLGCRLYVNIGSRPSPNSKVCQPIFPESPPLPKRKGKTSAVGRRLALLNGRSYSKKHRRRPYREQHKATSGKSGYRKGSTEDLAE